MKYKVAVFDMDGTILNTIDDLTVCLNYTLKACGYPERSKKEVLSFVGNGIHRLVECGVPAGLEEAKVEEAFQLFMEYYKVHFKDQTRPYDGVIELIDKIRASGMQTSVVSNKADAAVQELCKEFFDGFFDVALGERKGIRKKPAPDSVEEALKLLNCEKKDAVYIGDSEVDIATARNAGLDCIAVAWGFRDREFLVQQGAARIADTPTEVWKFL